MKNMNFPWAGELHRRAGWQAAQQDRPLDCTLSWPTGKGGAEGCSFLQHAPPFSATLWDTFCGITLNGGPVGLAGWRAVLPNEKHELSAGWRAAQSRPAGCTTGLAGGLHIKGGQRAAH